jgi:hypothetical protein
MILGTSGALYSILYNITHLRVLLFHPLFYPISCRNECSWEMNLSGKLENEGGVEIGDDHGEDMEAIKIFKKGLE